MGKIEKFRDCPAIGRRIKPIECGQNRGVRYKCTPDCPACPWTVENYDTFSEIERLIDGKTIGFYSDLVGEFVARTNLDLSLLEGDEDDAHAFQANCYREFFIREIEPGKKLFDLWREAGWRGLTRDEPFLAGFKTGIRATLIEIQDSRGDREVECIDLLDPAAGSFTVCDRSLASTAVRFDVVACWLAAYPFFHRVHGFAYPIPGGREPAKDRVFRVMREMGAPDGAAEQSRWLGSNLLKLRERINGEHAGIRSETLRNMDFKECVAVYRVRGSVAGLNLSGREDFVETPPDDALVGRHGPHQAFVWLRAGKSQKWESELPEVLRGGVGGGGIPLWGDLRIFDDRVELSASNERNFRIMRKMAETFFDGVLEFDKEMVLDELGLPELKAPARESGRPPDQFGWWFEFDKADLVEKLRADPDLTESKLDLESFPELAEYFSSIDEDLLNDDEFDALTFLINFVLRILVPPDVVPDDITAEEMLRETGRLFENFLDEDKIDSRVLRATRLFENSSQPVFLDLAANLLTVDLLDDEPGLPRISKGDIRPKTVIPMLIQLEAFLVCLRRRSLG